MLRIVRFLIPSLFLLFVLTRTSFGGTYLSTNVTVTGTEQQINGQWDSGTYTVSLGTYSETVPYGRFSTASSIAAAISAKFSTDPSSSTLCSQGICAKAKGATIVFYITSPATTGTVTTSTTPSFSGSATAWATLADTTTNLVASTNSVFVGSSITFVATISPALATGTVEFYTLGGGPFSGFAPVINGTASITISPTYASAAANYSVQAYYKGDSNYAPSAGALNVSVVYPTFTTLSSSLNPSILNQQVTFTVGVTYPNGPSPYGQVSIYDNQQLVSTGYLSIGSIQGYSEYTYSISNLTAGSHQLYASYAGFTPYPPNSGADPIPSSSSPVLTQFVDQPIISSLAPSSGVPGDLVTIRGTGFTSSGTLYFGGVVVQPIPGSWTDTEIQFKVPSFATASPMYALYVSLVSVQSNGIIFTMGSSSSCPY